MNTRYGLWWNFSTNGCTLHPVPHDHACSLIITSFWRRVLPSNVPLFTPCSIWLPETSVTLVRHKRFTAVEETCLNFWSGWSSNFTTLLTAFDMSNKSFCNVCWKWKCNALIWCFPVKFWEMPTLYCIYHVNCCYIIGIFLSFPLSHLCFPSQSGW